MLYSYRDLVVWQKAIQVSLAVYRVTAEFPSDEKYGLVSQMRRSAVSIASNIAEGKMRGSDRSTRSFYLIALGSAGELDTQIVISKQVPWLKKFDFTEIETLLDEVLRMLNRLIEQAGLRIESPKSE